MVHLIGPYFIAQFTAALKSASGTSLKHSSARIYTLTGYSRTHTVQFFFLFCSRTHRERWCWEGTREEINLAAKSAQWRVCHWKARCRRRRSRYLHGPAVSGFMNRATHTERCMRFTSHTHSAAKNCYDLMYVMLRQVIYGVLRHSHPLFYFLKMECLPLFNIRGLCLEFARLGLKKSVNGKGYVRWIVFVC